MDAIFLILLLLSAIVGLVGIGIGIYLLIKRRQGQTEIEIPQFGTLKTTQNGVVLIFLSIFLFIFSITGYYQMRKKLIVESQLKTSEMLASNLTSTLINEKDFRRLVNTLPAEQRSIIIIAAARILREEFRKVTFITKSKFQQTDFAQVEDFIKFLLEVDQTNGHGLYYAGEVKRWLGYKERSHEDFNNYLEAEEKLPESERGGGTDREVCYQRARGYCKQRTGWICHLLANDYYEKGRTEPDKVRKRELFRNALNKVKTALYNFPSGFSEHRTTLELKTKLLEELKALGDKPEAI